MTKTDLLIKLLPVNLQARTRAVFGFIALGASIAAVLFADNPKVAVAVQALITLGLLSRQADGSVVPVDEDPTDEGHLPTGTEFEIEGEADEPLTDEDLAALPEEGEPAETVVP